MGVWALVGDRAVLLLGGAVLVAAVPMAAGCAEGGLVPPAACVDGPVPAAVASNPWALDVAPVAAESVIGSGPHGSAPHVAWDGHAWTVAWGEQVVVLDGEARAVSAIGHAHGPASAIEAGTCQRAVATRSDRGSTVRWLEDDGSVARTLAIAGTDVDLARGGARWWIASRDGGAIDVRAVDGSIRAVEHIEGAGTPRIAITPAGVTVAWADEQGLVARTLARPDARATTSPQVSAANTWADGALELAALGDRLVLAAADGTMVHAAIVDPRDDSVAGPIAIARTTSRARPGIAAIPERGLAAICYAAGPGPTGGTDVQDRVELIVVDRSGHPIAPALALARGTTGEVVRAVSCAWSGREVLVTWWRTRESGDEIAIQRARVGRSAEIISDPW